MVSENSGKLDVLDFVISVLVEHEKKIDSLIEKLDVLAKSLGVLNETLQKQVESTGHEKTKAQIEN